MERKYGYDLFDGREVPQLVINGDHVLTGTHAGTVHVESGLFTLEGTLQGALDIQPGALATINGNQQGSVSVGRGSTVTVLGTIQGSVNVHYEGTLVIEYGGKLSGSIANEGLVIVRGAFGGSRSGHGEVRLAGEGYIKQPIIRDGVAIYEW